MAERNQYDLFASSGRAAARVLGVGELTRDLKGVLEGRFPRVAVQGEISNLVRHGSGHVYFTLKDAEACLSAVLFRAQARLLKLDLQQGQSVVARGRITVYEPRGQYQLACDAVEPAGAGALALAFEQLKSRLQAEGLFEAARKRPIPRLPRRLGVVTSPSGAAIRDFLRVLHHRFPNLPVLIAPARVQGEGAAQEIVQGLRRLCKVSERAPEGEKIDVVVLTRGGGSLEDLWAFNEEALARAIALSPIPVVSAVGHEVDFTICDFVADLRCPTPTAAAERLAPEKLKEGEWMVVCRGRLTKAVERSLGERRERLLRLEARVGDPRRALGSHRMGLDHRTDRIERALRQGVQGRRERVARLKDRLWRAHPRERLQRTERETRKLRERLSRAMLARLAGGVEALSRLRARLLAAAPMGAIHAAHQQLLKSQHALVAAERKHLSRRHAQFRAQEARLDALSPLQVLQRGYAIAFKDGQVIRRTSDMGPGEAVRVLLSDRGEIDAQVVAVRPPQVVE